MAGSSGVGTTLKVTVGTLVAVVEVKTINGISMSADMQDVTTQDSSGAWKEKVAGLKDAGDINFGFNATTANWTQLRGQFATSNTWEISFSTNTAVVATFTATLSSLSMNSDVAGIIDGSGTLAVSGSITWT